MSESTFGTLKAVNVNGHTEKKKTGNTELTYLSWPWAWSEVKGRFEDASYTVWKDEKGRPYTFDEQTGYMVYTTVTINGITHEMWLPVMDGANNAMKAEPYTYEVKNPNFKWAKKAQDGKFYDKYGNEQPEYLEKHVAAATMFDINKTIMRCLVKNLAMFGLGLYIYAGEDLPETEDAPKAEPKEQKPMSEEEAAIAAYPSKEEMVDYIVAHSKISREKVEALPMEKLMANYTVFEARERDKNG